MLAILRRSLSLSFICKSSYVRSTWSILYPAHDCMAYTHIRHSRYVVLSYIQCDNFCCTHTDELYKLLYRGECLHCSLQQTAADYIGIAQSTVSALLIPVCDAILQHFHQFVCMPQNEQECFAKAIEFAEIADFPRCIGAMDCTHIKINSPGGEISENFRCRHSYFSLNVQTIADAKLRIMNVVARWPGSTHDTVVFANSEVRQRFERGELVPYEKQNLNLDKPSRFVRRK